MFRGETSANVPLHEIGPIVKGNSRTAVLRGEFMATDPLNQDSRILRVLYKPDEASNGPLLTYNWGAFGTPTSLIWDRDFSWMMLTEVLEPPAGFEHLAPGAEGKIVVIAAQSVADEELCPLQEDIKLCRGNMITSGYLFSADPEAPESRTKITYIVQVRFSPLHLAPQFLEIRVGLTPCLRAPLPPH